MQKVSNIFFSLLIVPFTLIPISKALAMEVQFNEQQQGDILTIAPTATCDCQQTFIYKLSAKKISSAGTSTSSQSGRFETAPQHPKTLSKLSFNITKDTSYELLLIVTDIDGNSVAKHTLTYP